MVKELSIIMLLIAINSLDLFSQKEFLIGGSAGPSTTNIFFLYDRETRYHAVGNPFFRLSFHIGAELIYVKNENISFVGGLQYERIGSSGGFGFNKTNHMHYDMLGIPVSVLIKPVKKKPISLEYGIMNHFGLDASTILLKTPSYRLGYILGVELPFAEKWSFRFRFVESYEKISKQKPFREKSPNVFTGDERNKSVSFQLSLVYKLKYPK